MSSDRPSDAAILASVSRTLRSVVLPGVHDDQTRATIVQLIALAEYAGERGPDPATARRDELIVALNGLAGNELLAGAWPGEPFAAAAQALVACVGRADAAAGEVRAVLRPLLVGHLDEELAHTTPLIEAFRGRLRDA